MYLTLGCVGIVGVINRLEVMTGRFGKLDILAPLVLVTAVVVRFIKQEWRSRGGTRMFVVSPNQKIYARDADGTLRRLAPGEYRVANSWECRGATVSRPEDNTATAASPAPASNYQKG